MDMTSSESPVVLVVEDDEKLLETYEMWLDSDYDLRTAANGEEALETIDDDVQVVLLDRLMPGLAGDEVLDRIRELDLDCQVAMITAVEPDFDIAEMPFDAYLTKAIDRGTVKETVERLIARTEYDDVLRDHYAVAEKLSTLEARKSETELAKNEAYQDLRERFEELEERLSARAERLDRDDIVNSIDGTPGIRGSDAGQTDSRDDDT